MASPQPTKRTHPREYNAWAQMVSRCHNPRNRWYAYYGGRGVAVCERWRRSFAAFMEDMGPRPSPGHTVDRKENDGPYCPENCRWATRKEQAANCRTTHPHAARYEHAGLSLTAREWAERTGVKLATLHTRLWRKWPLEKALTP